MHDSQSSLSTDVVEGPARTHGVDEHVDHFDGLGLSIGGGEHKGKLGFVLPA